MNTTPPTSTPTPDSPGTSPPDNGAEAAEFAPFTAGGPVVLDIAPVPVQRIEVLRYLSYPPDAVPDGPIGEALDRWIDEAATAARPQGVYAVFEIAEIGARRLRLKHGKDTTEFRGSIGKMLAGSRLVAAFIATAGDEVQQLATRALAEGDPLAGMIVNGVGAERVLAAEAAVMDHLRTRALTVGLAPTLPYSPGYCGMPLTAQVKLFALFDGQTAGVSLSAACLMTPVKSTSGLVGLVPAAELGELGSPCDQCDMPDCNMRR